MIYETGKTYRLHNKGDFTIKIEEIGEENVILKIVTNEQGKVPGEEEDGYLIGPAENFQGWMTFQLAKEIK